MWETRVARRAASTLIAITVAAAAVLHSGQAQDPAATYPNRAIRIAVGFTAGGGNDLLARVVGQKLSESFGQPVVIENKPGAGAIIATEYVKNQPPDGYTLLMGASGAMTVNPAVYTRLPYNTQRDFVPISMVASFPFLLLVNPATPVKNVQELVAYAKADPAKANYGSSSPAFQLTAELFKQRTGAPLEHIPYKGSNESLTAVIANQVLVSFVDAAPAAGQIASGQVRALAVTTGKRSPHLPAVPTLAEAGVPDVDVAFWSGLFAPAGTPATVVKKLQDEVRRIVRLPDVAERLKQLAVEPGGNTSEEFAAAIAADLARWTAVAKASNIKIEQ